MWQEPVLLFRHRATPNPPSVSRSGGLLVHFEERVMSALPCFLLSGVRQQPSIPKELGGHDKCEH